MTKAMLSRYASIFSNTPPATACSRSDVRIEVREDMASTKLRVAIDGFLTPGNVTAPL
jgi:hypothetical protein